MITKVFHWHAVSASYGLSCVSPVTFTANAGDMVVLVGASGVGKSQLLSALANDLYAQNTDSSFGIMEQTVASFDHLPITGSEWLRCTGRMPDDVVISQLKIANILHQPLRTLSGGQLQRVHLAQALSLHSSLLFIDEPSTGLDLQSEELVITALDNYCAEGNTIIAVTHAPQLMKAATTIVLLDDHAKQIHIGPAATIMQLPAFRHRFGDV